MLKSEFDARKAFVDEVFDLQVNGYREVGKVDLPDYKEVTLRNCHNGHELCVRLHNNRALEIWKLGKIKKVQKFGKWND